MTSYLWNGALYRVQRECNFRLHCAKTEKNNLFTIIVVCCCTKN